MDDRIRISDADRERVTARLREHYAEGRLSSEELDERIAAALNAKTFGDLRGIMTDLPEPPPDQQEGWQAPTRGRQVPPWAARRPVMVMPRPRIVPLAIIVLIAALVIPGAGWVAVAFVKILLVMWLVACLAAIFAAFRFRRRMRRYWQSDYARQWRQQWQQWHQYQWRG